MRETFLNELFRKIEEVTQIKDVAYHEFKDGKLSPVHKTHTEKLGIEKWKTAHAQNPVYIKDTGILLEIVDKRLPIIVADVENNRLSAPAFFSFGIDSIMILPVIKEDSVVGIICVPSIGKLHNFTTDAVALCKQRIDEYAKHII